MLLESLERGHVGVQVFRMHVRIDQELLRESLYRQSDC